MPPMKQPPTAPVLIQVTTSLPRGAPQLASLSHVVDLVSAYLDGSVHLTPPQAAARVSPRLLDRVLTRVMHDPSVDDAFRSHWLAGAIKIAIQNNSLDMVQQIHRAYPEPLHVCSLRLALQHGTLEMVLWVVENRNDRLCCAPGVENLCDRCLGASCPSPITRHDSEAIVGWLASRGIDPSHLHDHRVNIVRWLDDRGYLEPERLLDDMICKGPPTVETVSYLLGKGTKITKENLVRVLASGATQRELEPVIDVVVASSLCDSIRDKFVWGPSRTGGAKVLRWDEDFLSETLLYGSAPLAVCVAEHAAHFCHLDTLKWLWHEHGVAPPNVSSRKPTTEDDLLALYQWMLVSGVDGWCQDDCACAARGGYLTTLRWLLAHKPDLLTDRTMETAVCLAPQAVAGARMDIVEWLHDNCDVRLGNYIFDIVARTGDLQMVQWILATFPHIPCDTNQAMVAAAKGGHLEVMLWLHDHRPDACSACVLRALLLGTGFLSLSPLKWLTFHATRNAACLGHCVRGPTHYGDSPSVAAVALRFGELPTARFLLEHHRAAFTAESVRTIVSGGHLPAIQWLYAVAPETVDWNQLAHAAREIGNDLIANWVAMQVINESEH